MQMFGDRSDIH